MAKKEKRLELPGDAVAEPQTELPDGMVGEDGTIGNYNPDHDAIQGGIAVPGSLAGSLRLMPDLLSDRLFVAIWPSMYARLARYLDAQTGQATSPAELIAAAATVATWQHVDDVLEGRLARHKHGEERRKASKLDG